MVNGTFIFVCVVIIAVCFMLVMIVLSQNPKGGGLSSSFGGGGSQMFGVQRTNDFLDRATWTLAGIIAALIIVSNFVLPRESTKNAIPNIDLPADTAPAPENTTDAPVNNNDTPAQSNESTTTTE